MVLAYVGLIRAVKRQLGKIWISCADWQAAGKRLEHHLVQTPRLAGMYKIRGLPVLAAQLHLCKTTEKLHAGTNLLCQPLEIVTLRPLASYAQLAPFIRRRQNGQVVSLAFCKPSDRK